MNTIGRSLPRADGRAKVTGSAQYVDDLRPDGCLHGATVRSDRAHARVLSIDRDPTFDWTDITLVTAADIPGENAIALLTNDQPCLADGIVRHASEPIALVAAPTRERALAAARHVRVTYQDLPALFDPETSEGNDNLVYGTDNVFSRLELQRGIETDRGHQHEGTYRVGLQEQLYLEPQGMLALPLEGGKLTIIGSMQCPYYVVKAMHTLLGPDRVNVVQATTGGGFGGKEDYPSLIAGHAALLALKTGRPVKLVYSRDEDLWATTKRHPARITIRSRVDDEGNLLSWDADVLLDGGAYNTLTPVVLSRAILHATGPYRCDCVRLSGRAVATHTPPNGAFRGFGAPQVAFAAERHMDRIARELGLDPVKLRSRNLYRNGDTTATGQVLADTGGQQVFSAALTAMDDTLLPVHDAPGTGRVHHAGSAAETRRLKRGRGLSMVFHGCGFTGNGEARIKGVVDLLLEGDKVVVLTGSTDIGQGVDTLMPQIVSSELRIPVERVRNAPHDTALVPDSGPTVASRTCMVVGGVAQKAAIKLRLALQAETGLSTDDFDQLLTARSTAVGLRVSHQYSDDGQLIWDNDTYTGDAYPTFGWACSVVDVDVDLDTGEVLYRRFLSATDVGKAINPVIVEGQLDGGSVQALGYATAEEVVLDERHSMANNRLTNYIIPTTQDAPPVLSLVVEVPYKGGPFGAKGIGEIPMDGPAPAVAQAIEAATGAVLDTLPMTPERVLAALMALEAGR